MNVEYTILTTGDGSYNGLNNNNNRENPFNKEQNRKKEK